MGSNLSIRLAECGFEKDAIGLFSLLSLPVSCKLAWIFCIDYVHPPIMPKSPRKGWLATALLAMALSLYFMGQLHPKQNLLLFSIFCSTLALFSGCLYMVGLAYELECIDRSRWAMGSACVTSGYRIGLLCGGACALYLAFVTNWTTTYTIASLLLVLIAACVLLQKEPYKSQEILREKKARISAYKTRLSGFWHEVLLEPCKELFGRSETWLLLYFILLFKLPDELFKGMEGPFYLQLGFTKKDIALASKMFGFAATCLGAFCSAYFIKNKPPMLSCASITTIHTLSLGTYCLQAYFGRSFDILYASTALTHLTTGAAMTSFIHLLWQSTDSRFAAVQYALLWSIFSFKAHLTSCLGGLIANQISWLHFFILVCLTGCITSFLLLRLAKQPSLAKFSCN